MNKMNKINKNRILRAFGIAVKRFRKQLNISQEEFAYRSGLHRTYISSVERGNRNVSLYNFFRIANALEITPGELVKEIETLIKEENHEN